MTIKKCDICGKELEFNHHNQFLFNADGNLLINDETKNFSFEVKISSFNFNCTNFDVCKLCLIIAMKQAQFKI